MSIGQELLNVPMGEMIEEMATAIANAQIKLDENSIEVAEMMGGLKTIYNDEGDVSFEDSRIFFGKEKITLKEAVDAYNQSTSTETKGRIENASFVSNTPGDGKVTKNATTGEYTVDDSEDNAIAVAIPSRVSMLEIGFTPTFYQFVDTILEVRMAISMTREFSSEVKVDSKSRRVNRNISVNWKKGGLDYHRSRTVTTTNVNATYASKYNYSAEGSSLLRTKLTPIPPPPVLEDRIRRMMESEFDA